MNLEDLYIVQKSLNDRIVEEHGLDPNSLKREKLLALMVELGELANETRCFKYWSSKGPSPQEVILEEYVDCLHFILTIGIDNGFTDVSAEANQEELNTPLTSQFTNLFLTVSELLTVTSRDSYHNLLQDFFTLGLSLGFTSADVKNAYHEKNQKNHRRQDEHY